MKKPGQSEARLTLVRGNDEQDLGVWPPLTKLSQRLELGIGARSRDDEQVHRALRFERRPDVGCFFGVEAEVGEELDERLVPFADDHGGRHESFLIFPARATSDGDES